MMLRSCRNYPWDAGADLPRHAWLTTPNSICRRPPGSPTTSPISPGRCGPPGCRWGPGRVIDAVRAVAAAGFTSKAGFLLHAEACFVSRPEHRAIFAQIFRLYWRDPRFMEHMMAMMLPAIRGVQEERGAQAAEKRAAEALLDGARPRCPSSPTAPKRRR